MSTVIVTRRLPPRRVIAAYRIDHQPVAVLACGHRHARPWRFESYHRCGSCADEQRQALDIARRSRVG